MTKISIVLTIKLAGFPTWPIFQHLLTVEEEKNKHLVEQLQLVVEKFDQRNEKSSEMENNLAEKLESAEKDKGWTLQNYHETYAFYFFHFFFEISFTPELGSTRIETEAEKYRKNSPKS